MMTMKNLLQRARKTIKIKNMLFLTIAGIINAFGITIFLNPVNLYDSGISGTAMLAAITYTRKPVAFTFSYNF